MAIYTISNRPAAIKWEKHDWVTRTLQNCKNLIRLRMGDVPYDRLRGLDPAILDKPMNEVSRVIRAEVENALLWEPDAQVVAVRAKPADIRADGVSLLIEVDISIDE